MCPPSIYSMKISLQYIQYRMGKFHIETTSSREKRKKKRIKIRV